MLVLQLICQHQDNSYYKYIAYEASVGHLKRFSRRRIFSTNWQLLYENIQADKRHPKEKRNRVKRGEWRE